MITNRGTLVAAIARWTRTSNLAADDTDDFIGFAHARLNRMLRTRDMLSMEVDLTSDSAGLAPLPIDFLEVDYIRGTTAGDKPLPNVSSVGGYSVYPAATVGDRVGAFAIVGSQVQFYPARVATLKLRYYKIIPELASAGDTNWLLTRHPDAYLYGAVMHMKGYVDDDRVMIAAEEFNRIISEIKEETKRQELASANLEIHMAERHP